MFSPARFLPALSGLFSQLVRPSADATDAQVVIAAWSKRARTRRQLRHLPPHLLRDIGLTSEQADQETEKPFWRT